MSVIIARSGVAAAIFVVSAQGALADLSAQDVWADWKAYLTSTGYTVSGTEAVSGSTLTVSDVSMVMLGWPGSEWSDAPCPNPPFEADWQETEGEVRHTFTHFHLMLRVMTAELPAGFNQNAAQELIPSRDFRPSSLPTVMRKAFELFQGR